MEAHKRKMIGKWRKLGEMEEINIAKDVHDDNVKITVFGYNLVNFIMDGLYI